MNRTLVQTRLRSLIFSLGFFSLMVVAQTNPSASLVVHVDKPGIRVSPTLYGIFFEEINCAGDGGLYAEMVRNRSFEESVQPVCWDLLQTGSASGAISIDSSNAVSLNNRHCLRFDIKTVQNGAVGLANRGYWGIALQKGSSYGLSLFVKCSGGYDGRLVASLERIDGRIYAVDTLVNLPNEWRQLDCSFEVRESDQTAQLVLRPTRPGTIWLDDVSLFPKNTFKDRKNGLRNDLASRLSELHPGFVRFPGGCWVEGDNLGLSYRWKQTIGAVNGRRTQYNIWQYYSTNGLGFHEYLQMCEDLGAKPLFVINCGMSHHGNVPMDQMQPWVQDALDAIEYANGPADSQWGSIRAENGHPAPFDLEYMEIGNENGGPAYRERYALFYNAIKTKYPAMHLVADVWGGYPKDSPVEMIDEHYYSSPRFFIQNTDQYDRYDRKGPKIYVGEYAVTQGCGQGNLRAALGEAAFMTGMERNSDIVVMASYAPLFANINYKKWNPDLINFDNARSYGTPSYYVQRMFSENRGDVVLPVELNVSGEIPEPKKPRNGKIGLGTWTTQSEYKDVRVVKDGKVLYQSDFVKRAKDWSVVRGTWKTKNGLYQQAGDETDCRTVAGDTQWSDYTITVKARKLGGREGFLVLFSVKDDDRYVWLNIGGWGNTQHALELAEDGGKSILGKAVPGSVETGRWYNIRVELQGERIRCYLDAKLIIDETYDSASLKPLHAVAGWMESSGEVVMKVVNVSNWPITTDVDLKGVEKVNPLAREVLLTSGNPTDENTIDQPEKVVPKESSITVERPQFRHVFPANSVTVLRLKKTQ